MNLSLILMIVAIVCLVIALFGAAGVVTGVTVLAWFIGGMLSWAVAVTVGYVGVAPPILAPRRNPPVQ